MDVQLTNEDVPELYPGHGDIEIELWLLIITMFTRGVCCGLSRSLHTSTGVYQSKVWFLPQRSIHLTCVGIADL